VIDVFVDQYNLPKQKMVHCNIKIEGVNPQVLQCCIDDHRSTHPLMRVMRQVDQGNCEPGYYD